MSKIDEVIEKVNDKDRTFSREGIEYTSGHGSPRFISCDYVTNLLEQLRPYVELAEIQIEFYDDWVKFDKDFLDDETSVDKRLAEKYKQIKEIEK